MEENLAEINRGRKILQKFFFLKLSIYSWGSPPACSLFVFILCISD